MGSAKALIYVRKASFSMIVSELKGATFAFTKASVSEADYSSIMDAVLASEEKRRNVS